jgi:hydrogenase nickel incorporation protein HypB
MNKIRLIEIGEEIHEDNRLRAAEVKSLLGETHTRMINIMASPGAGKTSLILKTAEALKENIRISVIEADIDSLTDAEKLTAAGIEAVQLHTGGFCHVDAYMMQKTLEEVDLEKTDLLILENVGNLICPAQSDTGAQLNLVISSVPEGDDKPLKYPLIFRVCDVLIINKIDFLPLCDFDIEAFRARARLLNPKIVIFELSCRTGEGIEAWTDWLRGWGSGQP